MNSSPLSESNWTWPADRLYKALCQVFDENDDVPRVHRDIAKRRIKKLYKQGKLHFENIDGEWVWRLCAADLMQHNYDWFGWEKRSEWCWELCTKKWFYPKWGGEPCDLLVLGEQGIGDGILFASCFGELLEKNKGHKTTFEVDDRMIGIMERSFPEGTFVTRFKEIRYEDGSKRTFTLAKPRLEGQA